MTSSNTTGARDQQVSGTGLHISGLHKEFRVGTKTVVARSLPKGNDYRATARFRPSDNTFKRCHDSTPFAVAAVNNHNHNPNGDNSGGPGGLLPDTGGPALLWLLLGLGLVGGGTGAVVYSRRKQAPAPATV